MIELMLHNLEKYEEFSKKLEETQKCAYVAAFGTGKSYVVCKYIEDHNLLGHELILCPTTAVIQQWKTVMPELNIITYQKLTHGLPDLTDIRLIVCDEMHHLGGRVWEQKFREMTDGFGGLIAGTTATPVRHLDGGRNTVDEFFDGNVVWGMDIGEAINAEVLPKFSYTAGLFSLPQYLLENREEACKDEKTKCLYDQLDALASQYSVDNILQEKLPSEKHKVIVFINRIDNIKEIENLIRGIYPDAAYFSVHRKLSWKQNEENICSFEACGNQAFLFCIDMLSEGRHIKDVDTVVMFRKTISPNVYMQQLGRCLDGGTKTEPQVFDFVGNLYGLREYQEGTRLAVNIIRQIQERITRPERQILVDSHVVEMLEVISRITAILDGRWLPEEDDLLRRNYNKANKEEIEKLIPNHTWRAIQIRASLLGLANGQWTSEENNLIVRLYNEKGGKEHLQELLPGRTRNAIRTQARRLGIVNGKKSWTKEEDDLIQQLYNEKDGKERLLELLPGRTWIAIRTRARRFGIVNGKKSWTKEDDDLIQQLYNEKDGKERLLELLPGRTWEAIKSRAKHLGVVIKRLSWTKEEDNLIRQHYNENGGKERLLELLPERTWNAIQLRAQKLGVVNGGHSKTWTKEEDDLIRKNYNADGGKERLRELLPNRTRLAIRNRAFQIGIANGNKPWTKEEDDLIMQMYNKKGGKERLLELLPGRTWVAIQNQAKKLGVTNRNKSWTREEDDLIRQLYNEKDGKKRLLELLPERTWKAIMHRAMQLGVANRKKPWSKEENDLIRQYYNEDGGKERLQELVSGRTWTAT